MNQNVEKRLFGKDLRIGDTVEVWWSPRRDTITGLKPYCGPFQNEPAFKGCQIAELALSRTGIAIFADEDFTVLSR